MSNYGDGTELSRVRRVLTVKLRHFDDVAGGRRSGKGFKCASHKK